MRILLLKARLAEHFGHISPPLGLLYLSAYLKSLGHETRVLHLDATRLMDEGVAEVMKSFSPDIVGLSAITAEADSMHALAALSKASLPGVPVIAGGPYPSGYDEECLADSNIDAVARGEGELTLAEIAGRIGRGEDLSGVAGVTRRNPSGGVFREPDRSFIPNLDDLPMPDWEAVNRDIYSMFVPHTPLLYGKRYLGVLTSRGCPYKCVFCHAIMGKCFRPHSVSRVVSEIELLYRTYGVERIEVLDDTFNLDRERALAIFSELGKRKLPVRLYICGIRADLLDAAMIDAMAAAGVVYVGMGIESASPATQAVIGKNLDLDKVKANCELLSRKGIFTTASFLLGLPGESVMDCVRTLCFASRLKIHTAMISSLRAYKGSALASSVPAAALITEKNDRGTYSGLSPTPSCSSIAPWKLSLLKIAGNLLFYLYPFRLFRILRDIPEPDSKVLRLFLRKFMERTFLPGK